MDVKRILGVFLLGLCSGFVFGHSLGLELGTSFASGGMSGGPALTFRIDGVPLVFAASLRVSDEGSSIGLAADKWFFNDDLPLDVPVKWYVGVGGYVHIGSDSSDDLLLSSGIRVPVGLNAYFKDGFIEPFIQVAPSLGIRFSPSLEIPEWFVPFSVGVRFRLDSVHFKK